ncbi:HEAT repeat domain-containing protein [Geomonas sp. RF6]|uniref:HEAT repeat domain-containing protein n=1 Tax=Geomonas sp. RF6 TaxID=2897342 RepID=UPI001E590F83|nr:HEAT repeat domain-containing protein [Geomonas sp. RF6]UFS71137.1 HEAT repeat domain-containing protein [Geomonas sp. RF6]
MSHTDPAALYVETLKERARAFVGELSIYARVARSYPTSHPFVLAAAEKVLARLEPLTSHEENFRLGVSRSGFSVAGSPLVIKQQAVANYAAQLSAIGIVTLTFAPDLQPDELYRFAILTARPRQEIWDEGGITQSLIDAGIAGIETREIDTSELHLSEVVTTTSGTDTSGVWERLAERLSDPKFPATIDIFTQLLAATPAELAQNISQVADGLEEWTREALLQGLTSAISPLFPAGILTAAGRDLFRKMITFVRNLSPALRQDFVKTFLRTWGVEAEFKDDLFGTVGAETVSGVLDALLAQGGEAPSLFLQLMHRLADISSEKVAPAQDLQSAQDRGDLQTLFRKAEFERYLPKAYHGALAAIVGEQTLPEEVSRELAEECVALQEDPLDAKMVQVIDQIVSILPKVELGGGVRQHLAELALKFIRTNEFAELPKLYPLIKGASESAESGGGEDPFGAQFVMEVLDAAVLFGRQRYPQLRELVAAVGRPFVVPLIERLALAERRTLRRFYFDCLTDLGGLVREPALERLTDRRWFLVRNLIILLRAFPDLEVQRAVRKLVDHPHPKVHTEALKSLVRYNSPGAESLLVQELESKDPARLLAAVQLAELSPTPPIMQRLLAFLSDSGIGAYNLTLKRAVVTTLAAIGDLRVLPYLEKLLRSRNLLHPAKHRDLKAEIVRSLSRYPAAAARLLADEFGGQRLPSSSSTATMDQEWGGPA